MMPLRRESKKLEKSAQQSGKDASSESSEDSDNTCSSPPPLDSGSETYSDEECVTDEMAADWWHNLSEEVKRARRNCVKIYVLSPFLFAVVPPGHEDKLIDWSYECGLLPAKDVQQHVNPKNSTFEAIQIVENGFEALTSLMKQKQGIIRILRLKNDIIKCTSYKSALKCAEDKDWVREKRDIVKLPDGAKREMATISLILSVFHFAGHVQLSCIKKKDVLKQYNEDCKVAEKKALELKEQGNTEFVCHKFRAAISKYNRAVGLSPFNHIMYGNRALSYQKLDDFRHALIDAKRALILKPDWDKGWYRLKQAAMSLHNEDPSCTSFLTFCVGKELLSRYPAKQNGAQGVKKEIPETTKGAQKNEDDSGEGSVPELVSADECDTSSDESESQSKPDMPALLDEEASDSNESGIDEDDYGNLATAKSRLNGSESRRSKMSKNTLELLRKKQQEELTKKEMEPESKRLLEKKPEKTEKLKKNKEMNIVEKPQMSLPEGKTNLEGTLRKASKALLDFSFQEASENYERALGFIHTATRKTLGYADKKYVIVLYAYGTALIGLDVHKELEKAKTTFQNILTFFKKLNFPLAYYGLGLIHYRQNRFAEAIQTLEQGLSITGKSNGEIYWPGTDIVIEETKAGNLKVSFEKILTNCKYPPKPDAVCRFDNCTGLKKSIYGSDTDYKGFVRIICTDSCFVEYHVQCWKKLKSNYTDKSTDKDFLDSSCFTSNCFGYISAIQVYGTDGLKTEVQSEKTKCKKEKTEKVATTELTAGSKKKKRSKKKDQDLSAEVEVKHNDVSVVHEEHKCEEPDEKPPASAVVPEQEEKEPVKNTGTEAQNIKYLSNIPVSSMFVLKKEDDQQACLPAKQAKGKTKKKKTKNVQSLDEFLGPDNEYLRLRPFQYDDEYYDEIPSEPFTRQAPEGWMDPFSIPAHLHHEAREIENSLAMFSRNNIYPSSDPWNKDSIREYIDSQDQLSITSKENDIGMLENIPRLDSSDFKTAPGKYGPVGSLPADVGDTLLEKNPLGNGDTLRGNKSLPDGGDSLQLNNNSKINSHLPEFSALKNPDNFATVSSENVSSVAMTDAWPKQVSDLDKWANVKEFVPLKKNVNSAGSEEILKKDQSGEQNRLDKMAEKSTSALDAETGRKIADSTVNNVDKEITENIDKILSEDAFDGLGSELTHEVAENNKSVTKIKENVSDISSAEKRVSNNVAVVEQSVMKKQTDNIKTTNAEPASSVLSAQVVCTTQVENNKEMNEQNEVTPNSAIKDSCALVEFKVTKEKGVQSKPNTKNKTIMTEAMNEPYKAEYEKSLRSCQGWESKYQELLDSKGQLEQKYKEDVDNLENKLLECAHKNELEKREKNEKIKRLQEQLISDEKQIQALKANIAALESRHLKEKQQLVAEQESAEKLKSYSQQQTKRANTAEVQLLELQRYVNFIVYTKALQDAEITLYNIGQILMVNSTPQLQEANQKWQRYITECKVQFDRNKVMFDTSIPQLKEGKQLASLTSLRISRPAAYPGPPILHLPPGAMSVPGNKPMPGPAKIRPEVNRGPSPTLSGASSQSTQLAAAQARPDVIRPVAPQVIPTSQTPNPNLSEKPVTDENLKKVPEKPQKSSNSFEKIMMRLSTLYPNYSRAQMTNFIKEVRASKNGSLTGLSFDDIVACVTKLVKEKEGQTTNAVAPPGKPSDAGACGFSGPKARGPLPLSSAQLPRPVSLPSIPASTAPPTPVVAAPAQVPGSAPSSTSGNLTYEDDPCVICHDEMTGSTKNVSLDCGHTFHHDCIKKWLTGEQSTCPTCRIHALLPEEFPQLK